MRCNVFWGCVAEAKDAFNEWAKGKALAKDVIVHSHTVMRGDKSDAPVELIIVVFHPEGDYWEEEKEKILETMAKI